MKPNKYRKALAIFSLFAMIGFSGCGYGFRGTVNNLPPDIKQIAIPVFVNATSEPGAEIVFANALIYEFARSRILKVVPESEAQAVLNGKIKAVTVDSVILATTSQSLERRVTLIIEVTFKRADNQKIIWQNLGLARYETFKASDDPSQTDRNKEEAIRKIAKDLSERIHNGILENF